MSYTSRVAGRVAALLLVFFVVLAGACKRDGGDIPEMQGGDAVDARPAIEGFALVSAGRGKSDDQVAIELQFSQPLASSQNFDELIVVTGKDGAAVSGSWVLEGNQILRFPAVDASKDYTVLLRAGLAAADGKTLGKDETRTVNTGPVRPAVAFASQGSVLPARETRGLPVVSVNVTEVDVEFLRVRDSDVANFFVGYQRGGRRGSWELGESSWEDRKAITQVADSVYLNRFVLGGAENERRLSYLPVQNITELQEPGLYFALLRKVGAYDEEYETAIFFVSDIGLHLRAYGDAVFVHTASLKSGAPAGNVALEVINRAGEVVAKATTDGAGNALVKYKLDAQHVLVARSGNDVSMLPFNQPALDLSEFAVAGRAQAWFDVFAWSGRDLYRPGETVRVSALMRDFDGRAVKAQPLFMSLKQPDGKVFLETQLAPGEGGYYGWSQALPTDVPTGRWQVEFRTAPGAKEVVQGMTLRIEEFLPERMKLDLSSTAATIAPGETLPLQVDAAYLYGAPAAGNRFTARVAVSADLHPVEAFPDHHFGDPTITLPKDAVDAVDEALGDDGKLSTDLALPDEAAKAQAPVAVVVTGSVFESGGRPVTRNLKRTLWPAAQLAGARPLFDIDEGAPANGVAGFELLRTGADGKRVAGELSVTLIRERRDYQWRQDENGGWGYEYTARYETVETKTVQARADGDVRVDFPVEWGEYRLEIVDTATGLRSRVPFVAGWSWDNQNRGLDARPDKVKLSLDKTSYRAGDTLRITVTPPQPGEGILIVESDRLLHVQPLSAKPGETYELTVTEDWERHDVYITALVLRGGSAVEKTTPARAVGVVHVPMDRAARSVPVTVEAPKQTRPEQALPVTITAPALAGKTAWATVSAVDVGILNITRFPVPDASRHFFAQRRLGVDAYDLYGRVIESFDGEAATLRFGGDMALAALPQARRPTARVLTVDLFSGPVKLDAQGKAQVELMVPDFNGTLRVSALVFSDEVYGQGSSESILRAPILAEVSAPRALAPGDRSTVTLDLQNYTGTDGQFTVSLETTGPIAVAGERRTVSLAAEQKTTISYPLSGTEGWGVGTLKLRVEGAGHAVNREFDVPVRAAWGSVVSSRAQTVAEGGTVTMGTDLAAGLMPGTVSARMTVTSNPPIPFARALQDLLDYPYGCVEQTTTRGYAALLLDADAARRMGFAGLGEDDRRKRLESAFSRLAALQNDRGHFSMWGGSDSAAILTPYIAEFLLRSREAGFAVPEAMLQKTLERLNEDLLTGGVPFYSYDQPDHLRFAYMAHAGYVLSQVNRAPLGTLRTLYDNQRNQSLTGLPLLHLGLALGKQGDQTRGDKAIAEALAKTDRRPRWLGDYGSPLRDEALMLALLRENDRSNPQQDARLLALSRDLQARTRQAWYWLSTQEQIALARLGRALTLDADNTFSGDLVVGGETTAVSADRLFSRDFGYGDLSAGVRFSPRADAPLFATLDIAGVPRTAPVQDNSQISITREWYNPDGTPWKPGPLKEGQLLVAMLTVQAREAIPDALVVDLLPAGLEVENLNLTDPAQWENVTIGDVTLSDRGGAASLEHEEYRDDRYVAAIKLYEGQTSRLFYLVRAVTPGTYVVPPPQAEDMYRPELRGVGRAVPASVTVVQP